MKKTIILPLLASFMVFFTLVYLMPNRAANIPEQINEPDQTITAQNENQQKTVTTSQETNTQNNNSKDNYTSSPVQAADNNISSQPAPVKSVSNVKGTRIGQPVMSKLGVESIVRKYKTAAAPNDPLAGQWWEGAVTAETLWDLPAPQKQTLLAIVDTGVALDHEEFAGRMFINPGETGATTHENPSQKNCTADGLPLDAACNNIDDNVDGIVDNESGATAYENPSLLNCTDQGKSLNKNCNLIDDDGNDYVDDITGWDFVNQDPSPQVGQLNPNGVSLRHATMVTGIAAANANNSAGVAGVDWNTKILPLQSLDDDGYGDSITVGDAIIYAADMGADVINVSLGTDGPDTYILQAVEYAFDKGSVVVAAAGNDGCDCMIYPARYDITLSVGATDSSGAKASFSSFGNTLDIAAPGDGITSSSYDDTNATTLYGTGSGTSYAAPVISGLLSVLKGQSPNLTPAQLIALVTEQANKSVQANQHKTSSFGYGLTNFESSANRITTPKEFVQMYKLAGVTNGGVFYGSKQETPLYACTDNQLGTTPIYKSSLSKQLFTINHTDLRLANTNGYSSAEALLACMYLPHDTAEQARDIFLPNEISNIGYKSLLSF